MRRAPQTGDANKMKLQGGTQIACPCVCGITRTTGTESRLQLTANQRQCHIWPAGQAERASSAPPGCQPQWECASCSLACCKRLHQLLPPAATCCCCRCRCCCIRHLQQRHINVINRQQQQLQQRATTPFPAAARLLLRPHLLLVGWQPLKTQDGRPCPTSLSCCRCCCWLHLNFHFFDDLHMAIGLPHCTKQKLWYFTTPWQAQWLMKSAKSTANPHKMGYYIQQLFKIWSGNRYTKKYIFLNHLDRKVKFIFEYKKERSLYFVHF